MPKMTKCPTCGEPVEEKYLFECPDCYRAGCPECMPAGNNCICPECEEKGMSDEEGEES
jgi:hypothetical protein